jgi:hypothetical protein
LPYFEIEVCAYVAHLLLSGNLTFLDTRIPCWGYNILLFRHDVWWFCAATMVAKVAALQNRI